MTEASSELSEPKTTRRLSWHAVFLRVSYCMTILASYAIWAGMGRGLSVQVGLFLLLLYNFGSYKLFAQWSAKTIEHPGHLTTWRERMSALVRVVLPDAFMVGWLVLSARVAPAAFYQAAAAVVAIRVAVAFAIIWFFDRSRPRLLDQIAKVQIRLSDEPRTDSISSSDETNRKSLPEIILMVCVLGGLAGTILLLIFR